MGTLGLVPLFVCLCTITIVSAESTIPEEELLNHLRSKSAHPLARPVKNPKDSIEVKFGLSIQTLHLDEQKEALYSNVWLNYDWNDPFLKWNESEYGGVSSVRVPIGTLWHPDIDVYNSFEETDLHETLVVLYSIGTLNWVPRAHMSTGCTLDYEYFPYDTQVCVIKVGSWTYDGSKLNLTARQDKADVSSYTPNKEWNLIDNRAERHVKIYECCPEPYIDMTFTITLLRRSTYLTYVYVAPVVILSLLGAVIFVLPPGNPQKMTLGGALLICYSLFFLGSDHRIPAAQASAPLIDHYYMAMFIMLALSVVLSAIATNLAKRSWSHNHPPELVKRVVLGCLGRLLCVSYTGYSNFPASDEELAEVKAGSSSGSGGERPSAGRPGQITEWVLIATVFDRLFLVIYLVLTVLLTLILLLNHPHAMG